MRIVFKGNYIRMTCGEIGLVDLAHQVIFHAKVGKGGII